MNLRQFFVELTWWLTLIGLMVWKLRGLFRWMTLGLLPLTMIWSFVGTFSPLSILNGSSVQTQNLAADYQQLSTLQSQALISLLDSYLGEGLSDTVSRVQVLAENSERAVRYSDLNEGTRKSLMLGFEGLRLKTHGYVAKVRTLEKQLDLVVSSILESNSASIAAIKRTIEEDITSSSIGVDSPQVQETVTRRFNEDFPVFYEQLMRAIDMAKEREQALESLRQFLSGIQDQLREEDRLVHRELDQLFAALWTTIGGNRLAIRQGLGKVETLKAVFHDTQTASVTMLRAVRDLESIKDKLDWLADRLRDVPPSSMPPMAVQLLGLRMNLEKGWKLVNEKRKTSSPTT